MLVYQRVINSVPGKLRHRYPTKKKNRFPSGQITTLNWATEQVPFFLFITTTIVVIIPIIVLIYGYMMGL